KVNGAVVTTTVVAGAKIATVDIGGKKVVLGTEGDIQADTNSKGDYNIYFSRSDITSVVLSANLQGYQPKNQNLAITQGGRTRADAARRVNQTEFKRYGGRRSCLNTYRRESTSRNSPARSPSKVSAPRPALSSASPSGGRSTARNSSPTSHSSVTPSAVSCPNSSWPTACSTSSPKAARAATS